MADKWPESFALLHVLPQQQWHDDLTIIGNKNGLLALRNTIDLALSDGVAAAGSCCADGEGYWIGVACATNAEMDNVPYGYADVSDLRQLPDHLEARIGDAIQKLLRKRMIETNDEPGFDP